MSEKPEQTNPDQTQTSTQTEDDRLPIGYRPFAAALVAKDVIEDTVSVADATVDMATGNIKRGGSNLLKSIGSIVTAPINMVSRLFTGKDAVKISPKYEENPDGSFEGAPVSNTLCKTIDVADHLTSAAIETATSPLQLFNGTEAFTDQLSSAGDHVVSAGKSLIGKHTNAKDITNQTDDATNYIKKDQHVY